VSITPQIRIGLAQINPTVGDIDANTSKIEDWIGVARDGGATLVVFPELISI
jgi:NAD+ synthase (glutamine-hydrolysing)